MVSAIVAGIRANRITQAFPRPPMVIATGTVQIVAREVYPVIEFTIDRNLFRPQIPTMVISQEFAIKAEMEAQETKVKELEMMLEQAQAYYDAEASAQDKAREKGETIQPNQYDTLVRAKDEVVSLQTSIQGAKNAIDDCQTRLDQIVSLKPVLPELAPNMDFSIPIVVTKDEEGL